MSAEAIETQEKELYPPEVLRDWLDNHSPINLYALLKRRVLGQDDELRKAAILIYGFLSSMANSEFTRPMHFLIEGKSGCGKSTFANALQAILPCPVVIADGSSITPAGYHGADIGDWVSNVEFEEFQYCGVLVIDEIDKLMAPTLCSTHGNFHLEAMHTLLKLMDGGSVVDRRGNMIPCNKILVIGMGAFSDLREEVKPKRKIGFAVDDDYGPSQSPSDAPKKVFGDRGMLTPENGLTGLSESLRHSTKSPDDTGAVFNDNSYTYINKTKAAHNATERLTAGSSEDESIIGKKRISAYSGSEQLLGRFLTVLHFKSLGRRMFHRIAIQAEREIQNTFACGFSLPADKMSEIIDEAMSSDFGARAIKSAVWELFLSDPDLVIRKEEKPKKTGDELLAELLKSVSL